MSRLSDAALTAALIIAYPALAPSVTAHVTLETPQATAGATYKAVLRVPHGCDGAATTAVHVVLPEGSQGAKPMPKPGWAVATTKVRAEARGDHGATVTELVREITWSGGRLPDEHYDEFVIRFVTPSTPNETVPIPVTQTCENGATAAWTAIVQPGQRASDVRYPAPLLRLVPRQ